jgi:phage head maturation protease
MPVKSFPVRFKADPATDTPGRFEAVVSVFGNRDAYGDTVRPGAFLDTLGDWAKSGDLIPVLWSHRMDDPRFNIGVVTQAAELTPDAGRIPDWAPETVKAGGGLWVLGDIDTDPGASEVATAAHRLLKARRVTQFSFAYDVEDAGWGENAGQETYELRKLKLHEVSVTPVGANPDTVLIGAKGAALNGHQLAYAIRDLTGRYKAGRVISTKNETAIRDAVTLLESVLAAIDDGSADKAGAKTEEPPTGVKVEELLRTHPSTDRLIRELELITLEVASH